MGYSIYLIDRNKSINEQVVDEVVSLLPKRLQCKFDGAIHQNLCIPNKQTWGWSLRTDIGIRKNNQNKIQYISVSGSFGISGHWALDMVVALQQLLQRKGYTIEIFSNDFGFCNKDLYKWMGYDPEELKIEENF